MRFTSAYYFLILYSLLLARPMLPILADGWNHFIAEAEHIVKVHAVQGEDHAEDEAAKQGGEKQTTVNVESFFHLGLNSQTADIFPSFRIHEYTIYTVEIFKPCLSIQTPPPDRG